MRISKKIICICIIMLIITSGLIISIVYNNSYNYVARLIDPHKRGTGFITEDLITTKEITEKIGRMYIQEHLPDILHIFEDGEYKGGMFVAEEDKYWIINAGDIFKRGIVLHISKKNGKVIKMGIYDGLYSSWDLNRRW